MGHIFICVGGDTARLCVFLCCYCDYVLHSLHISRRNMADSFEFLVRPGHKFLTIWPPRLLVSREVSEALQPLCRLTPMLET